MSEIHFSPNIYNAFTIRSNEQKKRPGQSPRVDIPMPFLLQDLPSRNPASIGPASR
jgi:hypothetical protein